MVFIAVDQSVLFDNFNKTFHSCHFKRRYVGTYIGTLSVSQNCNLAWVLKWKILPLKDGESGKFGTQFVILSRCIDLCYFSVMVLVDVHAVITNVNASVESNTLI